MSVITACIIAYNAEEKLKDTLESLKGQVDHIVVGIDSKTTDKTYDVAKSFGATTFPFDLDDNFAKARDLSFSKAPPDTEWFLWIDSDDVFASDIPLHQLADEQPDKVAMVWLPYAYHRDEYGNVTTLFDRERLIRKSAEPKWQGRLHETCNVRSGTMARDKRVWVEHTNRTDHGKGERNFRILNKMVEADPNDHRAVLYLAHQYFAAVDWLNACKWYEKFIGLQSPGDVVEEKWQALVYLTKARRSAGDINGALRSAKEALMMCPRYADSYFELAHNYATKRDWKRAIHWHEEGLKKDQPDNILILNPLDYDFNPFVISHHAYANTGNLDQALADAKKAASIRPNDQGLVNAALDYMWRIGRRDSVEAAIGMSEYLLDNNEPLKARAILDNLPAGVISDKIDKARGEVQQRLAHLKDETEYENFYFADEDKYEPDAHLDAKFPRVDWTIERLHAMGAKKILEVGVGDGAPAIRYARAGFQVVGIDIDPRRVQRSNRAAVRLGYLKTEERTDLDVVIDTNAKRISDTKALLSFDSVTDETRKAEEEKLVALEARDVSLKAEKATARIIMDPGAQAQFYWGAAEDIPQKVKDMGPFDAVILAELLEHVVDPEKVLDEADKVGKHVIITTPDGGSNWSYFENKVNPDGFNHSGHVRAYSQTDLDGLLWKHGRIGESHVLADTPYILVAEYDVDTDILDSPPVVIYCGPGLEDWSPDQIDREGLGGSETAVVKLAEGLVEKGFRVMVYGPSEGIWKGVFYRHYTKFVPQNAVLMFIAWRNPALLDLPINAQVKYLWAHDIDFGEGLTEERASKIDGLMAVSQFHAKHLQKRYPFLKNIFVVGNGIDPSRFAGTEVRFPTRFAYASSPDRGLENALAMWPEVRKAIPDAELHVFYGWENYDRMSRGGDFKSRIAKMIDQPGVVWRGRLGQKELARELMKCGAYFYPGPHTFEETFCIAALEAQAAGAYPVTRNNGALAEINSFGAKLDNEKATTKDYVKALKLRTILNEDARQGMKTWAQTQTWTAVTERLLAQTSQDIKKATAVPATS